MTTVDRLGGELDRVDTCPRCKAYVQPEWDRCKICGLERLPDSPMPAPPAANAGAAPEPRPPAPGSGEPGRGDPAGASSGSSFTVGREVVIVGIVGLVVIVGVLVFAFRPSSPEVATGPATTVDDLTALPSQPISPTDQGAMAQAVDALCSGASTSIPGAASYPAPSGAPHVVLVQRATDPDRSVTVRSTWMAGGMGNEARAAELVLCSQFELLPGITNCGGYGGVRLDVQDATWTIEVRSATTGAVLASTIAPGTSGCPDGIMVMPDEPETRPRTPDRAAVDGLVEPLVMAP